MALYVTLRAIWTGNTRLLILCFYFHIYKLGRERLFAYLFFDLTRLRFYPATSTLLSLSKCLERTTGKLSTRVRLITILTICYRPLARLNRIATPSIPGESWFMRSFVNVYVYSRFYITPSTATGMLAVYIGCRCCQSIYEVMVR